MPQDMQIKNTSTNDDDQKTDATREHEQEVSNIPEIDLDGTGQEDIILEPAGLGGPLTNDSADAEEDENLAECRNAEVTERGTITGTGKPTSMTALPQILAAQTTAPLTGKEVNGNTGASPHSAEGKAARIEQLIAEGKGSQAMLLVHAVVREQARRRVRRAGPGRSYQSRDPLYFLAVGWREQWSGQDIVAIAQTLAKGVDKGDMSGTSVMQAWHDRVEAVLARQPDIDMAAIEISQMIVIKERHRNTAKRRSLANGLTEIQVQVAELTGQAPDKYVRPIRVADLDDADDDRTIGSLVDEFSIAGTPVPDAEGLTSVRTTQTNDSPGSGVTDRSESPGTICGETGESQRASTSTTEVQQ